MRITQPDVIRAGEKDLIESVREDLDWDAVREIVKLNLSRAILESRGGEIVVHNNQIAFRIDLSMKLNLSLMFGRDGTYIPADGVNTAPEGSDRVPPPETVSRKEPRTFPRTVDPVPVDRSMDLLLEEDSPDAGGAQPGLELLSDPARETAVNPAPEEDGMDLEGIDLDGISLDGDDLLFEDGEQTAAAQDSELTGEPDLDLDELSLLEDEADGGSMDTEIDDILKESRAFWEEKKDEP